MTRFARVSSTLLVTATAFAGCAESPTYDGGAKLQAVTYVETKNTPVKGDLAGVLAFLGAPGARGLITAAGALGLIAIVVLDPRLRRSPRLLLAGATLGLAVVAGWWVTGVAVDAFETVPRAQSLTFVSPVGRALYAVLSAPSALLEFGIGTLAGVTLGSFLSALYDREFRWEAFDDDREMRRHLLGAALMGGGGVLAGGCTIGQGISAGSMMALSWPLAIAGMMIGARIGIAFLMEGSLRGLWRRD